MLKKIKAMPIAAESLGVRSMCTYIETPDLRVLLDAGVSLCPYRFRLPPHPKEFEAIKEAIDKTYGKKGPQIVKMNCDAVDKALQSIYEVKYPDKVTRKYKMPAVVHGDAPHFVK